MKECDKNPARTAWPACVCHPSPGRRLRHANGVLSARRNLPRGGQNLRHKAPIIIVKHRLRHPPEERERMDMTINLLPGRRCQHRRKGRPRTPPQGKREQNRHRCEAGPTRRNAPFVQPLPGSDACIHCPAGDCKAICREGPGGATNYQHGLAEIRLGVPPLANAGIRCPLPGRRGYTPRRGQRGA